MNDISELQPGWNFDNTYARLPGAFFSRQAPTKVGAPEVVILNRPLLNALGLNAAALSTQHGIGIFSGNSLPEGADAIAQAYAGHQFGHFNILGDGRAILLGEHITPAGERYDIQLKGSGVTAYSRRGDGRAALGPMIREYVISEAMYRLGVPTTRSLAVVATGEPVYREGVKPGAVLTRVALSHIRVGTFQYAAATGDTAALRALADYTINRHFAHVANAESPYLSLLHNVIALQANLIAKWMQLGFIHGVMNTDNMVICGETIDYGPCAFMDEYDPATVFSAIDQQGRYAYGNQARIAHWNLARFAETLLPLLDEDAKISLQMAEAAIQTFPKLFEDCWLTGMRAKLGLASTEPDDIDLIQGLLGLMYEHGLDFTNTFRDLAANKTHHQPAWQTPELSQWYRQWQSRLERESLPMQAITQKMFITNPAVIPRNHQVEAAIRAAEDLGDYTVLERLLAVLAQPYEDSPQNASYQMPPSPTERVHQTFCGT